MSSSVKTVALLYFCPLTVIRDHKPTEFHRCVLRLSLIKLKFLSIVCRQKITEEQFWLSSLNHFLKIKFKSYKRSDTVIRHNKNLTTAPSCCFYFSSPSKHVKTLGSVAKNVIQFNGRDY